MAKKKHQLKKKRIIRRIFNSRGNIVFNLLLGIIIIGSIALVSGVFPKNELTPRDPNSPVYQVDPEDQTKDPKRLNLQLKTIGFKACSQTAAIEMILDRSNSMSFAPEKLPNLKQASTFFVSNLPDDAPFGLITFSDRATEEEPIQAFGTIKSRVNTIIQNIRAGGGTNTYEALSVAKSALELGIPQFPGRKFALIIVTDGEPSVGIVDPTAIIGVSNDIKKLDVKVYAIGITQAVSNRTAMIKLMTGIASPNSFFEAPDTATLHEIYNNIGVEMCKKPGA